MINVLSNGDADLSNGKSSSAAEDETSKDGEGGGSPNRKAPPPPKPSLVVAKEMTTAASVSAKFSQLCLSTFFWDGDSHACSVKRLQSFACPRLRN